ncbi:efflux RND transporter periplasmic adaptor subunit [Photobacterium kagoshimensis]|uniref:efflux RND transporter periplasmic adaptor subunit n=1 Tax=Photobacterium kagoshimensis TaxID=2910242 RepID=UPI003D103542
MQIKHALLLFALSPFAVSASTAVTVIEVQYQPVYQAKTYSTALTAAKRIQVIAQTSGAIIKKHIRNGQSVKKGDILIELEARDYTLNHEEAKANVVLANAMLSEAKSAFDRSVTVHKRGGMSDSAFDQITAKFRAAQAQLTLAEVAEQRAQIEVNRTKIRAKEDGKVTELYLDEGQLIDDGDAICVLVNDEQIDAIVEIPSNDDFIDNIKQLNAELIVDNESYSTEGRLFAVDGAIDPTKGSLRVRYRFNNHMDLLDGQYARVTLANHNGNGNIVVPQASVLTDRQGKFVYVVEDNKVALKRVQSLGTHKNTEILLGLDEHDKVITSGTMKLYSGLDVKIETAGM